VFPVDYIIADKFDKDAKVFDLIYVVRDCISFLFQSGVATEEEGIPDGWMGLDVGPKTRDIFRNTVLEAKTILWNGYLHSYSTQPWTS
jgi:phosphoglycerate kinase